MTDAIVEHGWAEHGRAKHRWRYADGLLSIICNDMAAGIGGEFAAAAADEIMRAEREGGDVQRFLLGLFICACAADQGTVTLQELDHG